MLSKAKCSMLNKQFPIVNETRQLKTMVQSHFSLIIAHFLPNISPYAFSLNDIRFILVIVILQAALLNIYFPITIRSIHFSSPGSLLCIIQYGNPILEEQNPNRVLLKFF